MLYTVQNTYDTYAYILSYIVIQNVSFVKPVFIQFGHAEYSCNIHE